MEEAQRLTALMAAQRRPGRRQRGEVEERRQQPDVSSPLAAAQSIDAMMAAKRAQLRGGAAKGQMAWWAARAVGRSRSARHSRRRGQRQVLPLDTEDEGGGPAERNPFANEIRSRPGERS